MRAYTHTLSLSHIVKLGSVFKLHIQFCILLALYHYVMRIIPIIKYSCIATLNGYIMVPVWDVPIIILLLDTYISLHLAIMNDT